MAPQTPEYNMYPHVIRQMASQVAESLGLDDAKREEVRHTLETYWLDKIAIVWTVADVFDAFRMAGLQPPTTEVAIKVLEAVLSNHCATEGVTWDTFIAAYKSRYSDVP